MKIFISYSTPDLNLVQRIANHLSPYAEVLYWNESKVPGRDAWSTIYNWIDQSDIVLAIITGNTVHRAMAVGQEVGRSKTRGKTVIPMIGPDVPDSELGCLQGVTYARFTYEDLQPAFKQIEMAVIEERKKIENQQLGLILLGVGALFLLASGKGK